LAFSDLPSFPRVLSILFCNIYSCENICHVQFFACMFISLYINWEMSQHRPHRTKFQNLMRNLTYHYATQPIYLVNRIFFLHSNNFSAYMCTYVRTYACMYVCMYVCMYGSFLPYLEIHAYFTPIIIAPVVWQPVFLITYLSLFQ